MNRPVNESMVRGERGVPLDCTRRCPCSRGLSNLLAAALMLAIGVSFLVWYYLHAGTRIVRLARRRVLRRWSRSARKCRCRPLGKLEFAGVQ